MLSRYHKLKHIYVSVVVDLLLFCVKFASLSYTTVLVSDMADAFDELFQIGCKQLAVIVYATVSN